MSCRYLVTCVAQLLQLSTWYKAKKKVLDSSKSIEVERNMNITFIFIAQKDKVWWWSANDIQVRNSCIILLTGFLQPSAQFFACINNWEYADPNPTARAWSSTGNKGCIMLVWCLYRCILLFDLKIFYSRITVEITLTCLFQLCYLLVLGSYLNMKRKIL